MCCGPCCSSSAGARRWGWLRLGHGRAAQAPGPGEDGGGGVRALLLVSGGLTVFAATTWLGGSGFLAVYAMGVIVGNRARRQVRSSLSAMDGYAWLSQAGMFLLLGLLVTPSNLLATLWPAWGCRWC
jgi:potassium/hydrogen antiporter